MTDAEASLSAALALIARLPGATRHQEPGIAWLASGRPLAAMNHVHSVRLEGDASSIDDRILDAHRTVTNDGSLPATWWIGPTTTPHDLGHRLERIGLEPAEPEYAMAMDLEAADLPPGPITTVGPDDLAAFLAVMGRSYGWSDPVAIAAWTELYRGAIEEARPPWWHVVVSDGARGVACASLFPAGDRAFVTNVGTVPDARGAGHGTAATRSVMAIARDLGFGRATLTASLMGRAMYARIGFREEGRLDRYVWPGD